MAAARRRPPCDVVGGALGRHLARAVVAAAALSRAAVALEEPGAMAKRYLSEDYFPGMTLLEPVLPGGAASGAWSMRFYKGSQSPAGAPASVDASGWRKLSDIVSSLETALNLPPLEQYATPRALFDSQGKRLQTVEELKSLEIAFFLEIGQWIWPPVRVGFEQEAEGVGGKKALLRTLSLRPKVFEIRDFFTPEETQGVMRIGEKQGLTNSQGTLQSADLKSGRAHKDFRTSRQAWLSNSLSPLIKELDQRTSQLTRVPASHNEPAQLLRYDSGQYYHSHMDWAELELYPDQKEIWLDSHFGYQDRLATVFWYLNDVPEGGETVFPKHNQPICKPDSLGGHGTWYCPGADDPDMASCEKGLKVRPRAGSVVMWYNYHANGRGDRNSLHTGCPVGENLTKWSANKWVSIKPRHIDVDWVDNHPALERFGFTGSDEDDEANDGSCRMTIENAYGESAQIIWVGEDEKQVKLGTLAPGAESSTKSWDGHAFRLQVGDRLSGEVECQAPESRAVLTKDFVLEDRTGEEADDEQDESEEL